MQNLSANCAGDIKPIVDTYGDMLYRICYVMLKNKINACRES